MRFCVTSYVTFFETFFETFFDSVGRTSETLMLRRASVSLARALGWIFVIADGFSRV